MPDACALPASVRTVEPEPPTRWSVGGLLLEAIAARDFDGLAACFAPDAAMRALLPSGAVELGGQEDIVAAFRRWFGGAEGFEVLDGTVGDVGGRLHVAWRLRVHPTPRGDQRWHVIEQQAFAHAGDRIDALDLLCSGFLPDEASTAESTAGEGA